MKKILILFTFLIIALFPKAAFSYGDFVPNYTGSVSYFGTGALLLPNYTIIYEKKDPNSKIIQKLYWDKKGNFGTMDKQASRTPREIFLTYSPENEIVLLSVIEDTEEGWYFVCYDQKKGLFGWINGSKEGLKKQATFYPYGSLFFKYGKINGIHIFANLDEKLKKLHSSPSEESPVIDEFSYPKFISPWLIQGNWMLVKIVTYENKTKTGWFRWRSDEGRLYAFINVE